MHAAYPRNNDSLSHSTHSINYCTLALSLASSQLQRRFSPPPPPPLLPPHTTGGRRSTRPQATRSETSTGGVGNARETLPTTLHRTYGKRTEESETSTTAAADPDHSPRRPPPPVQTRRTCKARREDVSALFSALVLARSRYSR